MGRLVTVSQSGEGADLIRRTLSGKTAGNWSVAEGKLGSNAVSSKVRVYEEVLSGAPLNAINVSDIDLTSVPASQIKYTVQDNAGTVTNIVLGDVTGESWIYGIGYGKKIKVTFILRLIRDIQICSRKSRKNISVSIQSIIRIHMLLFRNTGKMGKW